MKKLISGIAILVFFLSACKKADPGGCGYQDQNVYASTLEITYLSNWLQDNSITAQQHPSGIFYIINNPGNDTTGIKPTVCSSVYITYTGRFLGGAVFDSNTSGISFTLGQLITGWQKGLPLISEGGSITLYIPPSLAYGSSDRLDGNGRVVIPGNSYLHFEIQLIDVQ